jgi:hypothetical protein
MLPTGFSSSKLSSMHNGPVPATSPFVNVQPRFTVVLPEEERILISADTDFATLLATRRSAKPSVILFRRGAERHPEEQIRLLLAHIDDIRDSLEAGSIVIFEQQRIRIRALPIGS